MQRKFIPRILSTRTDTVSDSSPLVLPQLRQISLHCISFRDNTDPEDLNFLNALIAALFLRERRGCPLAQIEVTSCVNVDCGDIALLSNFARVQWDEGIRWVDREGAESDEEEEDLEESSEAEGSEEDEDLDEFDDDTSHYSASDDYY